MTEGEVKKSKIKREPSLGDNEVDNIHQSSNSHSKEDWQTITEDLGSSTDYHLLENPEGTADPASGIVLTPDSSKILSYCYSRLFPFHLLFSYGSIVLSNKGPGRHCKCARAWLFVVFCEVHYFFLIFVNCPKDH